MISLKVVSRFGMTGRYGQPFTLSRRSPLNGRISVSNRRQDGDLYPSSNGDGVTIYKLAVAKVCLQLIEQWRVNPPCGTTCV